MVMFMNGVVSGMVACKSKLMLTLFIMILYSFIVINAFVLTAVMLRRTILVLSINVVKDLLPHLLVMIIILTFIEKDT